MEGRSVEVGTCESDETELEGKRFSSREAQNWAARLYLMIFYLSAVFGAYAAGPDREGRLSRVAPRAGAAMRLTAGAARFFVQQSKNAIPQFHRLKTASEQESN